MPTARVPVIFSSVSAARKCRSRSTISGNTEFSSWIQPCSPISCPSAITRRCSSGCRSAATAGTKKVAGIALFSTRARSADPGLWLPLRARPLLCAHRRSRSVMRAANDLRNDLRIPGSAQCAFIPPPAAPTSARFGPDAELGAREHRAVFQLDGCAEHRRQSPAVHGAQQLRRGAAGYQEGRNSDVGVNDRSHCVYPTPCAPVRFRAF